MSFWCKYWLMWKGHITQSVFSQRCGGLWPDAAANRKLIYSFSINQAVSFITLCSLYSSSSSLSSSCPTTTYPISRTHTHTHIHIHARTHTHSHTHVHVHMHTHTNTHRSMALIDCIGFIQALIQINYWYIIKHSRGNPRQPCNKTQCFHFFIFRVSHL